MQSVFFFGRMLKTCIMIYNIFISDDADLVVYTAGSDAMVLKWSPLQVRQMYTALYSQPFHNV